MRLHRIIGLLGIAALGLIALSACGDEEEDAVVDDFSVSAPGNSSASDFDESQLPDDFPRRLIPRDYASGVYTQLGQAQTASFESEADVDEMVTYYKDLVGEPALDHVGDGQRTAQWDVSPWMLSVIGSADEAVIGITKVP